MDPRTGKKIRMGRLVHPLSHRIVIVAYSHGSFMGAMPGMRTREEILQTATAMRAADGLMVAPGMVKMLEELFIGRDAPTLIVQIDWQSYSRHIMGYQTGAAVSMTTVEQVAVAGGDMVMSYLYLGHPDPEIEKQEIARNAALVAACEQYGMLLMIEPRSAIEKIDPGNRNNPASMSLYARVSAEIGADLVKIIDPGTDESLARIVEECPVPVLLAGGSKKETFETVLERGRQAIQLGCGGVVYGRNIFQQANPQSSLNRVLEMVHGE